MADTPFASGNVFHGRPDTAKSQCGCRVRHDLYDPKRDGIEFCPLHAAAPLYREYYEAHQAVEEGIADFDLHNAAVDRLEQARAAIASVRGEE